jgi:hypothetical protein
MPETKDAIQQRFSANLSRVSALVATFRQMTAGRGRPAVVETDLLRAAVVLLHASFEDLLRSCAELILPLRPAKTFEDWSIPLPQSAERRTKLTLSEIMQFRGRSIDDVLAIAIQHRLDHASYNNFYEVSRWADELGLIVPSRQSYQPNLDAMMKRRHQIAHRADRNKLTGSGHYVAAHLSDVTVDTWRRNVEAAGKDILAQIT